jgi:hypothetical protein
VGYEFHLSQVVDKDFIRQVENQRKPDRSRENLVRTNFLIGTLITPAPTIASSNSPCAVLMYGRLILL